MAVWTELRFSQSSFEVYVLSSLYLFYWQDIVDIFPVCSKSIYIRSIPGCLCVHTWGIVILCMYITCTHIHTYIHTHTHTFIYTQWWNITCLRMMHLNWSWLIDLTSSSCNDMLYLFDIFTGLSHYYTCPRTGVM